MILLGESSDLVIEDFPPSMEVIHFPLSFVGDFTVGIVEGSKPIHFVIEPVSMVFAAINIKKCTKAISTIIFDFAHIFSAWRIGDVPYFILLDERIGDVLSLGFALS